MNIGKSLFFLLGTGFAAAIGHLGMWLAVRANVRVAAAAMQPDGRRHGAKIAFNTGGVVGMSVVGLGLLGAAAVVLIYRDQAPSVLEGFGFGAAMLAMFMRVGGGIFTKAADVGADVVGKVEQSIPEDDPRNAATIADNVGDNVGDCAGMAADLFESYAVTLVAALILGRAAFGEQGLVFPLLVPAIGALTAVLGIATTKIRGEESGLSAIYRGFYTSAVAGALLAALAAFIYLPSTFAALPAVPDAVRDLPGDPRLMAAASVAIGIVLAGVILWLTGYFTGTDSKPTIHVARTSLTTSPGPGVGSGSSTTSRRPNSASRRARTSARPDDSLALHPETGDAEFDDVAGLEEHRRLQPHAHAGRRPGVDQVTRLQHQELAQVVHQEQRVEDHQRGAAALPPDAVDVQPQVEPADVRELVGGDQPGPARIKRLGGLALAPLPAPLGLEGAFADVVDDDVAGDGRRRIGRARKVRGAASDHDAEFDLPVGLRRAAWNADVVVRPDHRVGRLGEQDGLGGHPLPGLGRVVAVVQPDAQDLVRARDRRAYPLAGEPDAVALGRPPGHHLGEPVEPVRTEEPLVEVTELVRDVQVVLLVEPDDRTLAARLADPHQFHETLLCGLTVARTLPASTGFHH